MYHGYCSLFHSLPDQIISDDVRFKDSLQWPYESSRSKLQLQNKFERHLVKGGDTMLNPSRNGKIKLL